MSMLKKAMIYLGLGPDEHYESYGDPVRPLELQPSASGPYPVGADVGAPGVSVASGSDLDGAVMGRTVRPISLAPPGDGPESDGPNSDPSDPPVRAVHSLPSRSMNPHAVSPGAFNDAQEIGDRFKSGQPVIVNLQTVDRDLRRRLVDFSSGLCYAMGGKMDRVADQVYLLTPADVEVSRGAARRRRG